MEIDRVGDLVCPTQDDGRFIEQASQHCYSQFFCVTLRQFEASIALGSLVVA